MKRQPVLIRARTWQDCVRAPRIKGSVSSLGDRASGKMDRGARIRPILVMLRRASPRERRSQPATIGGQQTKPSFRVSQKVLFRHKLRPWQGELFRMHRLAIKITWISFVLAGFAAAPAQAAWLEARTEHFIVYSKDDSDASLREFATRLERFDKGMRHSAQAAGDTLRSRQSADHLCRVGRVRRRATLQQRCPQADVHECRRFLQWARGRFGCLHAASLG